jgi:hypothetical protein
MTKTFYYCLISVVKTLSFFHFTFHSGANMINHLILKIVEDNSAVVNILDDVANMFVIKFQLLSIHFSENSQDSQLPL